MSLCRPRREYAVTMDRHNRLAIPGGTIRERLLAGAERDCFIGAPLAAGRGYRWTVNGVAPAPRP